MDDIRLPLARGNMQDIAQDADMSSQQESSVGDTPSDSMSTQGAKAIYEREAKIMIDYEQLGDEYKDVGSIVKADFLHTETNETNL
jgi:structural maintenance of chromosome 1